MERVIARAFLLCAAIAAAGGVGAAEGGDQPRQPAVPAVRKADNQAPGIQEADLYMKQWLQSTLGSLELCRGYWGTLLPRVEDVFRLTEEQKKAVMELRTEYEKAREEALKNLREKYETRLNDVLTAEQRKDKEALDRIGREYREKAAEKAAERAAKQREFLENARQGVPVNWAQLSREVAEEERTLRKEYQNRIVAAVSADTRARLEALMKEDAAYSKEDAGVPVQGRVVRMGPGGTVVEETVTPNGKRVQIRVSSSAQAVNPPAETPQKKDDKKEGKEGEAKSGGAEKF